MSDSQSKRLRGNKSSFRGGGEERNGFHNARIPPSKLDEGQRRLYKREAQDIVKTFWDNRVSDMTLDAMSREQRKAIHEAALSNGLTTRSIGKEPNRCIILSQRENRLTRSSLVTTEPILPSSKSLALLAKFAAQNPITEDEMNLFLTQKSSKQSQATRGTFREKMGVPPKPTCPKELQRTKDNLPASSYRKRVLESIEKNDVVIISGGTGCGKTTQVPQFILDNASEKKKKVRVMVTQPRRIAAISISERVAKERGESLGSTVGYQVRLESRKSEKTLLTYCTTGVLLRKLTSDPLASGITHIVMDEIHEREINTDYLLIALRECLKLRKDLKIILMSATIEGNMMLFSKYFQEQRVEVIRIESRTFDVKIFFIDEILAMSGYKPPESQVFFPATNFKAEEWQDDLRAIQAEEKRQTQRESSLSNQSMYAQLSGVPDSMNCDSIRDKCLNNVQPLIRENEFSNDEEKLVREWTSGPYSTPDGDVINELSMKNFMNVVGTPEILPTITVGFDPNSLDSVFVNGVRYNTDQNQSPGKLQKQKVDRAMMPDCPIIYHCDQPVLDSSKTLLAPSFERSTAMPMLQNTRSSINSSSAASEQRQTPSTASSGLARFSTEEFGGFGEKQRLAELLEKKFRAELTTTLPDRTVYYHPRMNNMIKQVDFTKLRFAEKYDMFFGSQFENTIDHNLLNHVIKYLTDSPVFGTILVFLPGFDDIQLMMAMIDKWKNNLTNMQSVLVIPLHSQMHSINHADVFKPVNNDTRKIILATNIAEASITIEDVIFVVDTGKVKEKSYNHETKLSTLAVKSIARSNAEQRSGRAGRVVNGYCIRLYSEAKFRAMPETQVAEMKRAAIYDVTLHAKLFAPSNMRISEFLSLAPEPPEETSIVQSMTFLEQIGAFYTPTSRSGQSENDEEECSKQEDPELTDLGRLMAKLPLDPQLSRMLLFGLSLKCLTPIINLVALLASREPYVLAQSDDRERQSKMKFEMAAQDFSDHLMYIRLCTAFCSKRSHKEQNDFCRANFLNLSTMKMVQGTRRQLLQELVRAKLIAAPERDILTLLSDPSHNKHSTSWTMVQSAIAAGCYPSIGVSSTDTALKKVQTFNAQSAGLHPSSILKKQLGKLNKQATDGPTLEYVVFQEMCQMSSDMSLSIKIVTAIPALTALLFTGPIRLSQDAIDEHGLICQEDEDFTLVENPCGFGSNLCTFNLDEWYHVKADGKTMRQFLRLRHKFMKFFLEGIAKPQIFGQDTDRTQNELLDVIRHLLDSEHTRYNYSPVDMSFLTSKFGSGHRQTDYRKPSWGPTDQQKKGYERANTSIHHDYPESKAVNHSIPWIQKHQLPLKSHHNIRFVPSALLSYNNPQVNASRKSLDSSRGPASGSLFDTQRSEIVIGTQPSYQYHNQSYSPNFRPHHVNKGYRGQQNMNQHDNQRAVSQQQTEQLINQHSSSFPHSNQRSSAVVYAPRSGINGSNFNSRASYINVRCDTTNFHE